MSENEYSDAIRDAIDLNARLLAELQRLGDRLARIERAVENSTRKTTQRAKARR